MRPSPRTLVWLAPVLVLGSACNDNVGCIFVDGCAGGGPLSPNEAVQPVDGEWVLTAPPEVVSFAPTGTDHPGTTPVVIVFSETLQVASVAAAFEIVREGGFPQPVRAAEALVSDGRVLVLLPAPQDEFEPGTYSVQLSENATVLDLTGQELDLDPGAEVGRFTVVTTPPEEPRLVATFPEDEAEDQGESLELVVVFDRPVASASITPRSLDVRVNGVDPSPDPAARSLRVGTQGLEDTRVYLYQRLGADGLPLPFGRSAEVEIRLSPAGDEITDTDEDADELQAETVSFQTLAFSPPLAASLLSDPFDAIGLANLTDGNPEELMLEVELDMAQPNDQLDLYLFGTEKSDEEDPFLIALLRSKRLTGVAPILSAIFTREEIDLQVGNTPDDTRFADGPITFALALRRGSAATPLRLLDLDPEPETILDPELDTTPPVLRRWSGSSGTSEFRSDVRGLALAGEADERVRGAEVSTPLGGNGSLAPVVGADDAGFFLAEPVPVGRVEGGTTSFSAVLRDRAQNPAPASAGSFFQLGGLGPEAYTPGQSVEVEVFAADTLLPLAGARVLVHSDLGNGVDFPFFASGTTGPDGRAVVMTSGSPSVAAIVTVVLPGHDLFTLHGVPVTRLSVPLQPTGLADLQAAGRAVTTDSAALAIAGLDRRYDDSRRDVALPRGFAGLACDLDGEELACAYGSEPIRAGPLGARSFFAGDFSQDAIGFDAQKFLQAFALLVPLRTATAGMRQDADLSVAGVLGDSSDPDDVTQVVPSFRFRLPAASGVVPPFEDDPDTPGILFAAVEATVPGLPGSLAVGPCASFEGGLDVWTVLGAYPGAITAAGSIGGAGGVDTDPYVRVELADTLGNASGIRPRLSTIQAGPMDLEFEGLRAPLVTSPLPATPTGGQAFNLQVVQVIGDERTEGGLYRVDLVDGSQRGWTLWRVDAAGAADVLLRVVDVADAGQIGLADGNLSATAAAFAWSSFAATNLLWSDVEREFELFARAAPVTFQKP